jgi:archaeosine synthase beta-subunit
MTELDKAIRALRRGRDSGPPPPKIEIESFPDGSAREIATVFLRNGECPLACVYCALYRQASDRPATGREIAGQIREVRVRWPGVAGLKLYNASSFFEPRSIDQSQESFRAIAEALSSLDLVVVEARSENAGQAIRLSRLVSARLEVAIGLETADDSLLRLLNKPTSLIRFRSAAANLSAHDISLRAFVLVGPPFVGAADARQSAVETFEEARRAGARVVSLLPVVSEHEPMEALRRAGFYSEISLDSYFETVCDCARAQGGSKTPGTIVLAETANLARLPGCPNCHPEKTRRLEGLNATGKIGGVDCADHRPPDPPPVRRPEAREAEQLAATLNRRLR